MRFARASGWQLRTRDPEIDIALDDFQLRTIWGLTTPASISAKLRGLLSVYMPSANESRSAPAEYKTPGHHSQDNLGWNFFDVIIGLSVAGSFC